MPSVRTVDGQVVEIRQRTSILISIFATLAWLVVALLMLGAILSLVISSMDLFLFLFFLVLAIPVAIEAKVLSFLRTKADISAGSATFSTARGLNVTLRRDRSFWITLEMVLLAVAGVVLLLSFGALNATVSVPYFGALSSIVVVILGLVLLAYIMILNFLRNKLVIPEGELTLVDTQGAQLKLTRHTSVWITLGMILAILVSLYFLIAFATEFSSAYQSSNYNYNFGGYLPNGSQSMLYLPYVGPALGLLTFLVSLVSVFVLNFLRTKVNLQGMGVKSAQPPSSVPAGVAPMSEQKFCPYCGSGMRKEATFCLRCGKSQPTT